MKLDLKNMGIFLQVAGKPAVFKFALLEKFIHMVSVFRLEHVMDFLTCRISVDVPNIAISI